MYKTIYIPVDNSDHSNQAVDTGVHLAKVFGSKIVGSHVYAAKMHDKRFKQMEAGLPEEYHDEKELDRQRQIHDSLITRGLQIITDSYLDYVDKKCNEANLPIERRSLEGRNWKVLAEDINTNGYDLVIMGALGVGAVKDSVIGSNTERVVRRVRNSDMLIIKNVQPINGGKIVVAVSEDIDPSNTDAIWWSIAYRTNPVEDVHVAPHRSSGHGPKSGRRNNDSSLLIDATLKAPFPPLALPTREFMDRARKIWDELGLPAIHFQANELHRCSQQARYPACR